MYHQVGHVGPNGYDSSSLSVRSRSRSRSRSRDRSTRSRSSSIELEVDSPPPPPRISVSPTTEISHIPKNSEAFSVSALLKREDEPKSKSPLSNSSFECVRLVLVRMGWLKSMVNCFCLQTKLFPVLRTKPSEPTAVPSVSVLCDAPATGSPVESSLKQV